MGAVQRIAEPYGYDPLAEWLLSNNNLGLNSFTQNRIEEEQNRQFGSNWYFYNNTTLTLGYSNFKKASY